MTAQERGLVYLFTGEGKGKTSAALGILLRGLARGWKVGWISWYKEASWKVSEYDLPSILTEEARSRLTFLPMGKGFFIREAPAIGDKKLRERAETMKQKGVKLAPVQEAVVVDDDTEQAHKTAAQEALAKAEELLPQVQLLVLDEICNAVADGLIEFSAVRSLIEKRGKTHIILTGRQAGEELFGAADLVSEIQKVKHPYDKGRLAVRGLDY